MMTEATANPSEDSPGLAAALAVAARGFDVFPTVVGGKIPAVPAWQRRATQDPDKIRAMWTDRDPVNDITYDRGYNPAIYTARYGDRFLCVVDVDVKRENGATEWACLVLDNGGIPDTFTVRTPSGGAHYYFVSDTPLATTASRLAPGIDTRGVDGFVVAPGAVINEAGYRVVNDVRIADVPVWLGDLIGPPAARQEHEKVVSILDSAVSIDKARSYLERAEPAIQGAGGNTQTFRVAARLKDLGVSELTALELMLEEWNGRCVPPWPYEELAVVVSHAYEYGKRPAGVDSAENAFRDPPEGEGGPERRRDERAGEAGQAGPDATQERPKGFGFKRKRDIRFDTKRAPHLVRGYLETNGLAMIYGPSNAGKTAVVLDLCRAVGTGEDWYGAKVERGAVLYIAAEAAKSVEDRVLAMDRHHGEVDWPFYLVADAVNFTDADQITRLLVDAKAAHQEAFREFGVGARLVVVDTMAAATSGANENDGQDMNVMFGLIRKLQKAVAPATILLVHHMGKDEAKGLRGSTIIRAALDTALEVKGGKIRSDKQRNMAPSPTIEFELRGVEIGRLEDGEIFTSVIAVHKVETPESAFPDYQLSERRAAALEALREALRVANQDAVTPAEWLAEYKKRVPGATDAALRGRRSELIDKKIVAEIRPKMYGLKPGSE